jgi:hypothetical protein
MSCSALHRTQVIKAGLAGIQPVLSTARVGFSQCSKHRHYRIALEFGAMRARIADERLNELQRRRLLRRTSAHNPVPLLIGEHREVLHRLHISPTGKRFRRAWDVDVPPGALIEAVRAAMNSVAHEGAPTVVREAPLIQMNKALKQRTLLPSTPLLPRG